MRKLSNPSAASARAELARSKPQNSKFEDFPKYLKIVETEKLQVQYGLF